MGLHLMSDLQSVILLDNTSCNDQVSLEQICAF